LPAAGLGEGTGVQTISGLTDSDITTTHVGGPRASASDDSDDAGKDDSGGADDAGKDDSGGADDAGKDDAGGTDDAGADAG
jgi:hypothetical protein